MLDYSYKDYSWEDKIVVRAVEEPSRVFQHLSNHRVLLLLDNLALLRMAFELDMLQVNSKESHLYHLPFEFVDKLNFHFNFEGIRCKD